MDSIEKTLGKDYLKRFKLAEYSTLFPPNWEALKIGRCPLCNNRIKIPRAKNIAFCKGLKHGKAFIISLSKLREIRG